MATKNNLHLLSPLGFRATGVYAGIKTRHSNDIGLLIADTPCTAAAVFTTNRVYAAPVKIGRQHVKAGSLRGIIVNSGCANACTGQQGEKDALEMCQLAAKLTSTKADRLKPTDFLPSSTGVIGHLLPMTKIRHGITAASGVLGDSSEHALMFGEAILTTDTRRKAASAQFAIGKRIVTLAGVAKGAGMIGPRMSLAGPPQATLLSYLTTDAHISAPLLRKLFQAAADDSYNAMTIDDHCSTNDTALILASGLSGASINTPATIKKFAAALNEVTRSLAYQIAADGEGATKVVRVVVTGAKNDAAAKAMARSIANSPLVKCAFHGNDPNWGRIVSAAGMAGVPFNPDKATLTLAGTKVFAKGRPLPFDADKVSKAMAAPEVTAELTCAAGTGKSTIYTCDFSKEYVTINADYHT
jgi:glutamate N-acetyltransferase/amino-acid N-acetyltransferase